MSRGGDITLTCWDGEHTFRLRIGELRILQEKCDAGPGFILQRLRDGSWKVDDIRETLRLGLIGAGIEQQKALELVLEHVDPVPLTQNIVNAHAVVMAAIFGTEEERLGKPEPAKEPRKRESAESSPSPVSMALEPSSDSAPTTSIEPASGNSTHSRKATGRRTRAKKTQPRN
jgi:hypothetical protein